MTDPTSTDTTSSSASDSTPIIPRIAWSNSSTKALADSFVLSNDPIAIQRRWGIVQVINEDGTLDVSLSGQTIQGIAYNSSYSPAVNDTVQIDIVGPDMVVMGTMAPSLLNPGTRTGTVTAVNTTRTLVTLTLDDGTVLTNVPALAPYIPYLNDSVLAASYQGQFFAIGSEHTGYQPVRRATGDIEPSLTVKTGTLALNGQTVSRTTYAALWAWAQANSLVATGLFTNGNGSTTFGLPNFSGRTVVGAGTLGADTYAVGTTVGSSTVTLATAQMPAHSHSVTVANHAAHTHTLGAAGTASAGSHSHTGGTGIQDSNHGHGFTTAGAGGHDHAIQTAYASGGHDHAGPNFQNWVSQGPGTGVTNGGPGISNAGTFGGGGSHSHTGGTGIQDSNHGHGFTTDTGGSHSHALSGNTDNPNAALTHAVTESTIGGTTPVDVRAPSIGMFYVIWT